MLVLVVVMVLVLMLFIVVALLLSTERPTRAPLAALGCRVDSAITTSPVRVAHRDAKLARH
ncbi:MAG: hypothetical protein ACYC90_09275 [Candidatus Nanopelagicales bacterium]